MLVQEAEDQDICTVAGRALVCGTTNNADGKPDTLQELALPSQPRAGRPTTRPTTATAPTPAASSPAFLYRTDRVELRPAAGDPVLGATPTVTYRGAALPYNTRRLEPEGAQRRAARRRRHVDRRGRHERLHPCAAGRPVPRRRRRRARRRSRRSGRSSNHFSSRSGREGRPARASRPPTAPRSSRRSRPPDPHARIDVGGDLNVFPRPDDPFPPPDPSDQLAPLYDLGSATTSTTVLARGARRRRTRTSSRVRRRRSTTCSSPTRLGDELEQVRVAHINADWPAEFAGDGARGASDHDPVVARYDLPSTLAQLQALLDYYEGKGLVDAKTATQLPEPPGPGGAEARRRQPDGVSLAAPGVRRPAPRQDAAERRPGLGSAADLRGAAAAGRLGRHRGEGRRRASASTRALEKVSRPRIAPRGTTVVVATHDDSLARMTPRRITVRDGRVTEPAAEAMAVAER